jgi:hypothetical protein
MKKDLTPEEPGGKPKPSGNTKIPVMKEKVVDEKEITCFPFKTYLYTAACAVGSLVLLSLCIRAKIIFNTFGNRIDYSKLFVLLLILLCIDGYLMKRVWDKKNRITRIVARKEYIDPGMNQEAYFPEAAFRPEKSQPDIVPVYSAGLNSDKEAVQEEESKDNMTCVLNDVQALSFMLKPLDTARYETIPVTQFPFFIGKLKKNTDYCLEHNAVSRYHAKLSKEQDRYYITDLNSTNGTFLNKEALNSYEKREIKPGDEIAFANIKFLFIIRQE